MTITIKSIDAMGYVTLQASDGRTVYVQDDYSVACLADALGADSIDDCLGDTFQDLGYFA